MQKVVCKWCDLSFKIYPEDVQFYNKFSVPIPTYCPDCRQLKRAAFVNQINLFKRKCDASGKDIISSYPPDSPFKIFSQEHWYTDLVDNTNYGITFDFNKTFFEQFKVLQKAVPRPALFTDYSRDSNSDYTNFAGRNRNCYLIFDSDENWDCLYSYSINSSRSTLDSYRVENLELCYEVLDSRNCYNCSVLRNCESCSDSLFLSNCIACKNCICCSNLRQKQYYFKNKFVGKEEYQRIVDTLSNYHAFQEQRRDFFNFLKQFPQKSTKGFQNENVYGNYLTNSKNAYYCFDCRDAWDTRYCFQSFLKIKDCMDCDEIGEAELVYECSNLGYNAYNVIFSAQSLNQISNLSYCDICFNGCEDLFGCIGLKKKKYCILNKQYSKEEYSILKEKVIEHMKNTGEWGEFFPADLSTCAYNHSVAFSFYPLTKERALELGYSWYDNIGSDRTIVENRFPENIAECDDSLKNKIFSCTTCSKNYKLIAQEVDFYRKQKLPIPRNCFFCRHQERLNQRDARILTTGQCANCQKKISKTTVDNSSVFCEECFVNSLD